MKTLTAVAITLLLFVVTTVTPAQACPAKHMSLGLRGSYGVPMGTAGNDTDFNELTSGAVPVQIDVTHRINPNWEAGMYFAYGAAMIANEAEDGLVAQGMTDIGGHREQRVGIQGIYHIRPAAKLSPWAGVGLGYGWTRYAAAKNTAGKETEVGMGGIEAMAQCGGDYQVSPWLRVGPFASVTVGQFRNAYVWTDGTDEKSTEIDDKGVHEWVQVGLKASFGM